LTYRGLGCDIGPLNPLRVSQGMQPKPVVVLVSGV
jgi:hypothetical protein